MPPRDLIEALLRQAVRAPSSHNTQSWAFELHADRIGLSADPARALPENDPDNRELTISLGCLTMTLRVAAAGAGLGAHLVKTPRFDGRGHLGNLHFGGDPEAALAPLTRAIATRRTHRGRYEARTLSPDIRDRLTAASSEEGAWLEPILDPERRTAVASLVGDGDKVQWGNRRWRRELATWMRPKSVGDGLTLPAAAVPLARYLVRHVDLGRVVAAGDRKRAATAPFLAVLGTDANTPSDWLKAGQALQRLLLVAASLGLQASFLNQPVQVAPLRPKLQELCRHKGAAQILLCLGYPQGESPAAPRRPLAEA
ncbi:nitroreductase family protein [Stappia taiwanensis]|uniref:Nitroreductase family protein n=1 Tax=Stappia taiwanensis TaxID=992267 RepID=A0A838XNN4_9HYPH|nr:nitroreductase family protein [Stappia taiwanensis]MBA4612879.1 nitroreductase family protein [Stappia taiwanensis]GGF07115.1 hypothetical protein GCM10007285_38780 [Stappia taiwanensis]